MTPTQLTKSDKTFLVQEPETKRPLSLVRVAFHPTEPFLLGQIVDSRLAVWHLNGEAVPTKGKPGAAVPGGRHCDHGIGWITGFALRPDGRVLATGGSDRKLKLWPWQDGKPATVPSHDIAAHSGWIESVAYSPDGKRLATAGADLMVKVWQADDLKPLATLTGHKQIVRDLAWLDDGRLISGGEDGQIILWDLARNQSARTHDFGDANQQVGQNPGFSGVCRLALSHDRRWLAAGGGQKLLLFDVATGEPVATDRSSLQVAFHPRMDVLAGGDTQVKVWAYEPAKLTPAARDKAGKIVKLAAVPGAELAQIKQGDFSLGMAFAPDGAKLALGRADGSVELWELS